MRTKRVWTLALLIAFAFSMLHEYAYAALDDDHCSVQEYVHELSQPSDHGDICDTHYEYHTSYLLPNRVEFQPEIKVAKLLNLDKRTYLSERRSVLDRPPIS
jgi:hypothetical protein